MQSQPEGISRCPILGVAVSAIDIPAAVAFIRDTVRSRGRTYVTVTGVHGVMESQQDEELKRIHNEAGLVTPDGMPMVWISRARGHRRVSRVYGPDLMLAVSEMSAREGLRQYYFGAGPGVAETLATNLARRYPGLSVAGTFSPPFGQPGPEEDQRIVEQINATRPDILWVGLSTPKQERWMATHLGRVDAPVMIGVGAAFDFHAGLKKQAPRWMQRSGLEWFFRMATEPRRLAGRYFKNNPRFLWFLLLESLRIRTFNAPRGSDDAAVKPR